MQQETQMYSIIKWCVIGIDLLVLNAVITLFYGLGSSFLSYLSEESLSLFYFTLNAIYLICISYKGPILQMRKVGSEQIVGRLFILMLWFSVLSFLSVNYLIPKQVSLGWALQFYLVLFVCLCISRLISKALINGFRSRGRNTRSILFVGSNPNMEELYEEMMGDPTTGYRVLGYFDDEVNEDFNAPIPYLGKVEELIPYMFRSHFSPTGRIYCCLSSDRGQDIRRIIDYCENNLIRFYSVPNVRNYLRRSMRMTRVGDVPVLYMRKEPLRKPLNRLMKRTFDVVCSGLFLCTLFPLVYIVVGIITKFTSPGPIFFKQKRNGLNGEEFYCYKFRSMKVNAQSDTLQATEKDPRKTKFGNFLRKSSIDELPQFINVLKGDMSIVGPRPHMLKHTEEYSELINRYMVRHFIKPGITGWAQVTGCRGETKELYQMEERIKKDIWYVENWSFWLDLRIMYMTVANAVRGEANAY